MKDIEASGTYLYEDTETHTNEELDCEIKRSGDLYE